MFVCGLILIYHFLLIKTISDDRWYHDASYHFIIPSLSNLNLWFKLIKSDGDNLYGGILPLYLTPLSFFSMLNFDEKWPI